MSDKNQGYSTTDIYFAVYAQTMGHMPSVEYRPGSRQADFVFENLSLDEVESLTQEFHQDKLLQDFISNMKNLKDKLYMKRPPRSSR